MKYWVYKAIIITDLGFKGKTDRIKMHKNNSNNSCKFRKLWTEIIGFRGVKFLSNFDFGKLFFTISRKTIHRIEKTVEKKWK